MHLTAHLTKNDEAFVDRPNRFEYASNPASDGTAEEFLFSHRNEILECIGCFPVTNPKFFKKGHELVILVNEMEGAGIYDQIRLENILQNYFFRAIRVIFRHHHDDLALYKHIGQCEELLC